MDAVGGFSFWSSIALSKSDDNTIESIWNSADQNT